MPGTIWISYVALFQETTEADISTAWSKKANVNCSEILQIFLTFTTLGCWCPTECDVSLSLTCNTIWLTLGESFQLEHDRTSHQYQLLYTVANWTKVTCSLSLNNILIASNKSRPVLPNLIQTVKVRIAEAAIFQQEEGHPGERGRMRWQDSDRQAERKH